MIFWGTTESGARLLLGEPAEASLAYDRDAPADLLRARFPADKLWEELCEVELLERGEPVFRGVVDEQNTELSASGLTVELVCRSREALLLDNEAKPETIGRPSLALLEEKLLAPLGLALGSGDREPRPGVLTVSKGDSCWAVLERFCGEYLHTSPRVGADGLVHCGEEEQTRLELSQVISARVSLRPCERISEVWQQSCRGFYDTPCRSGPGKPVRRRYLSLESGKSPKEVLRRSLRDSFLLTVTCAGARWPVREAVASVTVPGAGRYENCPVRSALYRRDKNGERTRLTLERPASEEECVCG